MTSSLSLGVLRPRADGTHALPGIAYDEEMKVFVMDLDTHEAYRRGGCR